jgi:hypothetical protein
LYKLIDTARLCGWVLLTFCVTTAIIALAGPEEYRVAQIGLIVAMVIGHGIPGLVFLALARWMSRGRPVAFVIMTGFTIFTLLKTAVGMVMLLSGAQTISAFALALPFCAPVQTLFLAYVGARCLIAWPEIVHLWKSVARSRAYAQSNASTGRPAATPAAPVAHLPAPPPPARGIRPRARPVTDDEA